MSLPEDLVPEDPRLWTAEHHLADHLDEVGHELIRMAWKLCRGTISEARVMERLEEMGVSV